MPLKPEARTPVDPAIPLLGVCWRRDLYIHACLQYYPQELRNETGLKCHQQKNGSIKCGTSTQWSFFFLAIRKDRDICWKIDVTEWRWLCEAKRSQAVIVMIAIAVQRHHDHGSCYKGKHFIGGSHFQRFSLLSSWRDAEAYSQTWCWERSWDWRRSYILILQATGSGPSHWV